MARLCRPHGDQRQSRKWPWRALPTLWCWACCWGMVVMVLSGPAQPSHPHRTRPVQVEPKSARWRCPTGQGRPSHATHASAPPRPRLAYCRPSCGTPVPARGFRWPWRYTQGSPSCGDPLCLPERACVTAGFSPALCRVFLWAKKSPQGLRDAGLVSVCLQLKLNSSRMVVCNCSLSAWLHVS